MKLRHISAFTNYSTSSEVPQNHIDSPSTYSQALPPLIHIKLRLLLSAISVAQWSEHCWSIANALIRILLEDIYLMSDDVFLNCSQLEF